MSVTQTIEQAGYSLIERWSDDEAILRKDQSGAYALWRVATSAEQGMIINTPNDGRIYQHVREVTEFELDDVEVIGFAQIG